MDLHNKTIPLARAAVRHCYSQALLQGLDEADGASPPSSPLLPSSSSATADESGQGVGPFFEIIIGRGKSLSPAVLQLLNEEFCPPQDARVKEDNPGRLMVPRARIREWIAARREREREEGV